MFSIKKEVIYKKINWIEQLRPNNIPIFFWLLLCCIFIIITIFMSFSAILLIIKQNTVSSNIYIGYLSKLLLGGVALNGLNITEIREFLCGEQFKKILIGCKIIFGFFILLLIFQLLSPILSLFATLCFIYFIYKYYIKTIDISCK